MKELVKVTLVKGSIVSAEIHCSTPEESQRAAAGIASLMAQDETFARDLVKYVTINILARNKLKETASEAIRQAEIKTKN